MSRRGSAAERAYARRAQRIRLVQHLRSGQRHASSALLRRPHSRTSFVLLLMALMVAGAATTLWLSTQAIADSYRLEELRQDNARLVEKSELLRREVNQLEAPPALAKRAEELGMVPGGNPARLIVGDDGSIAVIGEPTKAVAEESDSSDADADADADADGGAEDREEGDTEGD